jgi:hypothetical protein
MAGVDASIRDNSTNPAPMISVPATGKILYRPVRPTMAPLPIDVISRPATMGNVRSPDVVADTPSTNCMKVGRKVSAPSIAKPTTNDSTQHTLNTGLENSRIGSTGSAAPSSMTTKITSATIDPAKSPTIVGDLHG